MDISHVYSGQQSGDLLFIFYYCYLSFVFASFLFIFLDNFGYSVERYGTFVNHHQGGRLRVPYCAICGPPIGPLSPPRRLAATRRALRPP